MKALERYPLLDVFLVATEAAWGQVQKHSQFPAFQARIQWHRAEEVIAMDDSPVTAFKQKKNASMRLAARLVHDNLAHGMVSAGNTGAVLASALFDIGRLPGVKKPALAVLMPYDQRQTLMLDVGANAECKVENILQFAHIGSLFMAHIRGVQSPSVALLNIGTEEGKGNTFVQEAYQALKDESGVRFIGNLEGKDIFSGKADVIVCDGFSGNIALKSAEGMGKLIETLLKQEVRKNFWTSLGGLMVKPALRQMMKRVRPDEFGGALMLGVDGVCVKAHGNSNPHAYYNAVRVALEASGGGIVTRIRQTLSGEDRPVVSGVSQVTAT